MNNTTTIDTQMHAIFSGATAARAKLGLLSSERKNQALTAAATAIRAQTIEILAANGLDMTLAEEKGLSSAMLDRLKLDVDRISAIADGLEAIAALPDPVDAVMDNWTRPNGLNISRVRVPLGVIGVIYESRPNVTADAGALCLKAGNAVILRGGSESLHSSQAIHACLQLGLRIAGIDENAIQMVPSRDRTAVGMMLKASGVIDVIIPRGGKSLVARVQEESRVPVFAHLEGMNHIYLADGADPIKACEITLNAKMRRTGICGAVETLLIDRKSLHLANNIISTLLESGCEVRGDNEICALNSQIVPATEADWSTEYLGAIISVRVVDGLDDAMEHIAEYGSGHTDCIICEDADIASRFLYEVDSAIVMHNASTQFADGGEFGMGAEIGISTGRIHARGPVGLEQLTSFKYRVVGTGQTRP